MGPLTLIARPGDAAGESRIGGKAAALCRLSASPFADMIPPWFALTKEAFERSRAAQEAEGQTFAARDNIAAPPLAEEVKKALMESVKQLADRVPAGSLFAVRSSAVGEDGASASFAGQLSSMLNVAARDVPEAVRAVWASAARENVTIYRKETGGADAALSPAVLVQVMVPAESAGVGFSVDPVSGNPARMVVSACRGLGEKLVSGEVDGDTYYCTARGELVEQRCEGEPILGPDDLDRICGLLRGLEDFFSAPQDVEWAMAGGKLYLLQSRPITTLGRVEATGGEGLAAREGGEGALANRTGNPAALAAAQDAAGTRRILWDNSNIVESYSGVTSPLTFSFARYIYEHVYIEFCRFMGVSERRITDKHTLFRNMLGSINGHVYYNLLHWYEWLTLFPGFSLNRRFMEQMMGVGEELPQEFLDALNIRPAGPRARIADALRLARSGFGLLRNNILLDRKIRAFNKRLEEALSLPAEQLDAMPLDELCAQYRDLEKKLLRSWDAPLINDFLCMMAFGLSRKILQKYGGEAGLAYHRDMLIGQGDIISAEPARRIREMAALAAAEPALTAVLAGGDKEACRAALAAHPKLERLVASYLERFGDRCLQELKLESPTMTDEPGTLFSSIGHLAARLKDDAEAGQGGGTTLPPLAEVVGPGVFRQFLAGRLSAWAKKLVSNRENLRFERTRLFGRVRRFFVRIGERLAALGRLDEPRDVFYLQVEEALGLIEGAAVSTEIRELARRRKAEYRALAALPEPPSRLVTQGAVFLSVADQGRAIAAQTTQGDSLRGTGCCRGRVRGPVRVITDPRGAELKAGEIMVARFTDPGWITLFANAAGILIERGSLLSHSAIVARELNIPAIVGLTGVTRWLKTGDIVNMDGGTGVVSKEGNQ